MSGSRPPRPGSNLGSAAGSGISIVRTASCGPAGAARHRLDRRVLHRGRTGLGRQEPGLDGDLGRWNYLIGFGLIFLGLTVAAHKSTPLGRGRGVVVGMLGCFLIGLPGSSLYYITGQDLTVPVLTDLSQYNLMVGIGFMAVGFVYATHWE